MSKAVKNLITNEYKARYDGLDSACVVSVIGLDAIATNRLRRELAAKKIRLQVVKNSLARRAFADTSLAPLAGSLEGPCALVTGGESIIDVAKTLIETQKGYPKLELKLAVLGGDPELITVEQLSKMKSRQELLADIAMLIASPARRLAACLGTPASRIAGCVKTLIEKQEKAEAAAPAA
jgi:large subunit ribosomal protein L10